MCINATTMVLIWFVPLLDHWIIETFKKIQESCFECFIIIQTLCSKECDVVFKLILLHETT